MRESEECNGQHSKTGSALELGTRTSSGRPSLASEKIVQALGAIQEHLSDEDDEAVFSGPPGRSDTEAGGRAAPIILSRAASANGPQRRSTFSLEDSSPSRSN